MSEGEELLTRKRCDYNPSLSIHLQTQSRGCTCMDDEGYRGLNIVVTKQVPVVCGPN